MGYTTNLISRYYLYKITLSLGFYVPVSVIYLRDLGFSLAFIGLTWAVFSAATLLAEIPTGYLSDRLGRRMVLILGIVCRIIGIGGYAVATTGGTFLLLKVFTGLGWSLRSGTNDAFLYEILKRQTSEDQFTTIKGRGEAIQLATSAITALAGGILYTIIQTSPFIATALLAMLGIPILLSFPDANPNDTDPFTVQDATQNIKQVFTRPELRWLVAYTGFILLVFTLTRTFEQPALRSIGINATGLGMLYAAFKVISAVAGAVVGPLQNKLGTERLLQVIAPMTCIFYLGMLVTPAFLLPVAFYYRFTHTLVGPVRNQYLNDRLSDAGRATVLSSISMILSMAAVVIRTSSTAIVGDLGPIKLLGIAGAGLTIIAGVIWIRTEPIRGLATKPSPNHGELS